MNVVINVKTQEEYNELMEMYDKKWWERRNGDKPINRNIFYVDKETTCVDFKDSFNYGSIGYHQQEEPETLIKDIARARKVLWYDYPTYISESETLSNYSISTLETQIEPKPFIVKQNNPMSTLQTSIWNAYYKLNEKKITDLFEFLTDIKDKNIQCGADMVNLEEHVENKNKTGVQLMIKKLKKRKKIYTSPEYHTLQNSQQAFDDLIEKTFK